KDVLDVEDMSFEYESKQILHDVTWRLGPGDRVGLVGVNGAGKTTLLKLLTGELKPTSGRIKRGKTVQVAVLSQTVSELDEFENDRIYELIAREKTFFVVDKQEVSTTQLVEQLGFTKAQLQTPIGELSGGQRRRLQFLRLLFGEPNVLILDEPTNDLDTDILAAMEDLLDSWPGTLIVVSHDRYLLERVTDQQYALLGDGSLRHLTGGVDQYLKLRAASLGSKPVETNQAAPESAKLSGAEVREAEKNLARIERALEKLATDEAALHIRMAETDQSDFAKLGELVKEQNALNEKRDDLEAQWLETSESLS
ncbi:MAG: hypothetical protein RL683_288, partial [Actinomycetota bacterium]